MGSLSVSGSVCTVSAADVSAGSSLGMEIGGSVAGSSPKTRSAIGTVTAKLTAATAPNTAAARTRTTPRSAICRLVLAGRTTFSLINRRFSFFSCSLPGSRISGILKPPYFASSLFVRLPPSDVFPFYLISSIIRLLRQMCKKKFTVPGNRVIIVKEPGPPARSNQEIRNEEIYESKSIKNFGIP